MKILILCLSGKALMNQTQTDFLAGLDESSPYILIQYGFDESSPYTHFTHYDILSISKFCYNKSRWMPTYLRRPTNRLRL